MYEVIRAFCDLTDDNRLYQVGDEYPAKGVKPTKTRIKELLTGSNRMGKVYLREIEDAPAAPDPDPAGTPDPDPAGTPDPDPNPED